MTPDGPRGGPAGADAERGGPSVRVDEAAAAAAARSRTVGVVRDVADKRSTLAALGRALQFPDYYATNLDALEECLRDLSWLPVGPVEIVWEDGPLRDADPRTHRVLGEILAAASGSAGDHPLRVTRVG